MDEQTRNVLREAKGYVASSWAKGNGNIFPPRNGFCVITAVGRATSNLFVFTRCLRALQDELPRRQFLGRWNDAPERTHEEVVALFDRVLAKGALPEPTTTPLSQGAVTSCEYPEGESEAESTVAQDPAVGSESAREPVAA